MEKTLDEKPPIEDVTDVPDHPEVKWIYTFKSKHEFLMESHIVIPNAFSFFILIRNYQYCLAYKSFSSHSFVLFFLCYFKMCFKVMPRAALDHVLYYLLNKNCI